MEEKNNKWLIWVIIILIVLVLGLIGFIVYDKAFVKDINNNTTTIPIENDTNEDFINYPPKNDDSILSFDLNELSSNNKVDLTKNFKNIKLMKENLEYTISCTEYNEGIIEEFGYGCNSFEIIINNVKLKDYISEGAYEFKHIIIKEDYLILQTYSNVSKCGYIKIYSYIKSKVVKIKFFIYFASLFDTKSNFYDNLVLVKNKYKRGGGNFEK